MSYNLNKNNFKIIYGDNFKNKKSTLNPTKVAILETIDITIICFGKILEKTNQVNEIIQKIDTKIETMTDNTEKKKTANHSSFLFPPPSPSYPSTCRREDRFRHPCPYCQEQVHRN